MPTTETTRQIIRAVNTKNEEAISKFSTKALKDAIVDLGSINEGDRREIQFEIDERDKKEERKHQSIIRALSYIVTLIIGILAGYFGAKL